MKVLCVDGMELNDCFLQKSRIELATNDDLVYQNEIYTVVEEIDKYYRLSEKRSDTLYLKKRFVPISAIDETQLLKEREHETCKV